jgi:hypothetical protein
MVTDPEWKEFKENFAHCTMVQTKEKYYVYALYTLEFGYFYVGGAYGNANRINEHGGPKGASSSNRFIAKHPALVIYRRVLSYYQKNEVCAGEQWWWDKLVSKGHFVINMRPSDMDFARSRISDEQWNEWRSRGRTTSARSGYTNLSNARVNLALARTKPDAWKNYPAGAKKTQDIITQRCRVDVDFAHGIGLGLIKAGKNSQTSESQERRAISMKRPETRQKCREAALKRPKSTFKNASSRPEVREKIAASLRGRHPSEETRAKLRAAILKRNRKQDGTFLSHPEVLVDTPN